MRQFSFQQLQLDTSQPGFCWFSTVRVYLPTLVLIVAMLAVFSENAVAATGGQPFVIHETYEQHADAPETHKASHGVVGLDLLIQQGRYPMVQGVFRGTPAATQGLLPGDMILAINGITTFGKNITQVDTMISDVPGDRVLLTVQRGARLSQVRLTVAALDTLPSGLRSEFSSLFEN